ncbi:unnamed protein product [Angiostrongylus costaricensis]|uniref:Histone deacetylase 6 n=1 Tax=Angiostrongylus costaricensis TaxID=334426 RepID=A0A0R3PLM7_ANGCS|nr:unnamed protein product [Angiostrongylus costaricensis]
MRCARRCHVADSDEQEPEDEQQPHRQGSGLPNGSPRPARSRLCLQPSLRPVPKTGEEMQAEKITHDTDLDLLSCKTYFTVPVKMLFYYFDLEFQTVS